MWTDNLTRECSAGDRECHKKKLQLVPKKSEKQEGLQAARGHLAEAVKH